MKQLLRLQNPTYQHLLSKCICLFTLVNFLVSTTNYCFAQNLILNGDFEQFHACPTFHNQLTNASHWINPTLATPDYYNHCSGWMGVPESFYGYQDARSGVGFGGIITYFPSMHNYREYIETQITTPLLNQQPYYFEMYFNQGNDFSCVSSTIGVYFSDVAVTNVQNQFLLPFNAQLNNVSTNFPDTAGWTKISGIYFAHGGESYIIIGNFKQDTATTYQNSNPGGIWNYAYVNIDDILLRPTSYFSVTACDSYNWNGTIYTSSGFYTKTLTDSYGTDSIISVNLTIHSSNTTNISRTACDIFELNNVRYTSSGIYTQKFTTVYGCDSIVNINLTINHGESSSLLKTSCSYFNLNSETYTATGVYTQHFTTIYGCDSTLTIYLRILNANDSVSEIGSALTAHAVNASYQWIDCNNYNKYIEGESSQSYIPQTNGSYAVIVKQYGCVDTSLCYDVNSFKTCGENLVVYPNPNNGDFTLNFDKVITDVKVEINDISGRIVYEESFSETEQTKHQLKAHEGLYLVSVIIADHKTTCKLKLIK